MDIAEIQGEARQPGGRHANERLRRRGLIPAVIYGHNQAPEHVALSRHDTELALEHSAHVIKLKAAGAETQYLIKDVQYDHLQKTPIHVDLMRVDITERVEVRVPLHFRGTPKGVASGGSLVQVVTELHVECPLTRIPEEIRVHIEHLDLNDTLLAGTIELPLDVKSLHKPEDVVAVVHPPRGTTKAEMAEEGEDAEGAEPEVIGKGKEEEEGDGDGA